MTNNKNRKYPTRTAVGNFCEEMDDTLRTIPNRHVMIS